MKLRYRLPLALVLLTAPLNPGASAEPASGPEITGSVTTSVPLEDVLSSARTNASLQLQIRLQLHRARLARSDVWCRATVLDQRWARAAGQRVGPYVCPIGKRTLFLTGTYVFMGADGTKISAADPDLQAKTARVTETRFKWRWQTTRQEQQQ